MSDRLLGGRTQPIDPLSTVVKRQPPAIVTDGREISAAHRRTDPVKNVMPADSTSHFQSQPSKHNLILVFHLLLRPFPV